VKVARTSASSLPTVKVHFDKSATASCCVACSDAENCIDSIDERTLCCYLSKAVHDQLMHERLGHFYVPGLKVNCPACAASKKFGVGHKKQRPPDLIPTEFLEKVDWDFKGPLPLSFFNRRWILSAVDEASGWCENYPVFSKSDC
jgi:hypothetical protein